MSRTDYAQQFHNRVRISCRMRERSVVSVPPITSIVVASESLPAFHLPLLGENVPGEPSPPCFSA
jgi:hypothetical protein